MSSMGLYMHILVVALCLHVGAWFLLVSAWSNTSWKCLLSGVCGSLSMGISLLYFWALSHRPSLHQSFLLFNVTLLINTVMSFLGYFHFKRTTAAWKAPRKYQEQLLKEIIEENGDTEYGKRFNLRAINSLDDFRKIHPLTTYEHYRSYVDRMMDGERNVLTRRKPTSYVRTTGTTGKSKHIPYVSKLAIFQNIISVSEISLFENVPSLGPFQRRLFLYVHPQVSKAKSGARVETIATAPAVSDMFLGQFTTPGPGLRLQTIYESNYIHLLFGLRERDLGVIHMTFLTFLENAIEQLKDCWRDLILDMEHGTINTDLKLPIDIRKSLLLSWGNGDPRRAKELRQEFEKGFSGILKRIWPRLQVVVAIDRTSNWPKIESKFARGVQHLSGGYICSEGFFGVNLGPKRMDQKAYLPFPTDTLAEFIKEDDIDQSQPSTYLLDEVEEGECYEVVLTQGQSCLYRYRLGDVIKITGFYENCPYFQFMYRTGQMLNLIYEILDQRVVEDAIQAAATRWEGASLVDFAVAESTIIPADYQGLAEQERTPYYLFFIQIEGDKSRSSTNLSPEEKTMAVYFSLPQGYEAAINFQEFMTRSYAITSLPAEVEEELRLRNGDFDRLRREGLISHPRIYSVRPNAFEALKKHIIANSNASFLQYKIPQKLRLFPMVQVMLENSYTD